MLDGPPPSPAVLILAELKALLDDVASAQQQSDNVAKLVFPELPRLQQCLQFGGEVLGEHLQNCAVPLELTPPRQMFFGDLLLGLSNLIKVFGTRTVFCSVPAKIYNLIFWRCFCIAHLVLVAAQNPSDTTGSSPPLSPSGLPCAGFFQHAMPSCQEMLKSAIDVEDPSAGPPEQQAAMLLQSMTVGDFFLTSIAECFDWILRVIVFAYTRENDKRESLQAQQELGNELSPQHQQDLANLAGKVLLKKQILSYMWAVSADCRITSSAISQGEEQTKILFSGEAFLELCSNDIDLAVRFAKVLLELGKSEIAMSLSQMWDSKQNVAAVKELMSDVREAVEWEYGEESGPTNKESGTLWDIYEYKKKLAYLFIDEDIVMTLMVAAEKQLTGAAGVPGSPGGGMAGQPTTENFRHASLVIAGMCRCVCEMTHVVYDVKNYEENDVDLLSHKIENVVPRLERHLEMRKTNLDKFFIKWVFGGVFPTKSTSGDGVDGQNPELVGQPPGESHIPVLSRWWASPKDQMNPDLGTNFSIASRSCLYITILDTLVFMKCLTPFTWKAPFRPFSIEDIHVISHSGSVVAKLFNLNLDEEDVHPPEIRQKLYANAEAFLIVSPGVLKIPADGISPSLTCDVNMEAIKYWKAVRQWFAWFSDGEAVRDEFWLAKLGTSAVSKFRDMDEADMIFEASGSATFSTFLPRELLIPTGGPGANMSSSSNMGMMGMPQASMQDAMNMNSMDALSPTAAQQEGKTTIQQVPERFRCAIDGKLMETPVCYQSPSRGPLFFELQTLQAWSAERGDVCPVTGEAFTPDSITVDEGLKAEIEAFRNGGGVPQFAS